MLVKKQNLLNSQHKKGQCESSTVCDSKGWQYGTVCLNFCEEVWYAFFVMVPYIGTVRLFCNGTGTLVRCLNLKSQTFCTLCRLFVCRCKRQLKPTLNV